MAEKPIMHGRDHRPGGTDPIPGLGGLVWAFLDSGVTEANCAASSTTRLPSDTSTFYTTDTTVFDTAANTGIYGIRILADGHYAVWVSAQPTITHSPTSGDSFALDVLGGGSLTDFSFGGPSSFTYATNTLSDANLVTSGLMSVGGGISAPTNPIIGRINNLSSHLLTFFLAGIFVLKLDAGTTDIS